MKTGTKPVHPGVFLRTEIIAPLGLGIDQAAAILAVPRKALAALLRGKTPLDAEMAWRFEKAFDIGMEGMLRMQAAYDTARMRRQAPNLGVTAYIPGPAGRGAQPSSPLPN